MSYMYTVLGSELTHSLTSFFVIYVEYKVWPGFPRVRQYWVNYTQQQQRVGTIATLFVKQYCVLV